MKLQNVEDIYPLSPLQQGLLFHALGAAEPGLYLHQIEADLTGDLDSKILTQAWQTVLERHGILRTAFYWQGTEKPLQIVRRRLTVPFDEQDCQSLVGAEQESMIAAYLREDRRRGFDLLQAPLMRVALLRTGSQRSRLILTFHHILLDGWSGSHLIAEVSALYSALQRGEQAQLPPRRPYRDYIAWLKQQDLTAAETFWRQELAGFSTPTHLPVERGSDRKNASAERFGKVRFDLSAQDTHRLHAWVREHELTLNTVLIGAWALLLSSWSGEPEAVFGTVVSGRPAELDGSDSMVGLFINTLPTRVRVDLSQRLVPWLQSLQKWHARARQYEFSPLSEIQNWSEVPRGVALFDSLMAFENYPDSPAAGNGSGGPRVHSVRSHERTSYPLTVQSAGRPFFVRMTYDRDRFAESTIRQMLRYLEGLFGSMLDHPQVRLCELPLLTLPQRHAQVVEWNDQAWDYPYNEGVHDLFEQQCRTSPDAVALEFNDVQLSYRALNERANRLARHLLRLGVGPEVPVGIFLERSADLMVGQLAILKAGGIYVPLDPAYPAPRLAFMVRDAGIAVLMTRQGLTGRLDEHRARILVVDTQQDDIARESAEDLDSQCNGGNLAYIMYTSGSTGKPKGIGVPHRAITRLVWNTDYIQLESWDRVAQASNSSFDASTFEIWGAFLRGARLVAIRIDEILSPQNFVDQIRQRRISTLFLTTAFFNQMVREVPGCFATIRHLLFGGEMVDPSCVRQAVEQGPERLLHVYGPTESTTFATWHRVESVPENASVPIGRSIANTQAYLLDRHLRPVPAVTLGELFIGGDGLARGYCRRPSLSADRFIPDPLAMQPGGRLYRTGDLARFRQDGAIEFVGRFDHQVKVRGFRIELGEIEVALDAHPAVQETAVIVREDSPGRKRVVAYVVPTEPVIIGALREFLAERLPDYMMPTAFVEMESFPLTPNGKIDRRALPAPDTMPAGLEADFVAPRNGLEEQLAEIWSDLLGVDRISVHDSFFHLGGDSILSIQVASRSARLGMRLTPQDLFQHPTIAELAAIASTADGIDAEQGTLLGAVSLTPVQHWFFDIESVDTHHWNMAAFFELRQEIDAAVMELVVSRLIQHHDALRMSFRRTEVGWQQTILRQPGGPVFCRCDLAAVAPQQQRLVLEAAAVQFQTSLNLASGDVARIVYFHLGEGNSDRLLLIFHHLVFDAVSWRILLEDLHGAYEQASRGLGMELPAKTTSLQRWSERLTEHAQSPEVRGELDYWLTQDSGESLPVDHPAELTQNAMSSRRSLTLALTPEETEAIVRELPAQHATAVDEILLTAVVSAFAEWTGRRKLGFNLEGHGREALFEDVDLSRTVGWFTSMLPIVLDLGEASTPTDRLMRVKQQLRRLPNRGIGFGLLRYLSHDEEVVRALESLSSPQVSFNYLGKIDQMLPSSLPWRIAKEQSGPGVSPRSERHHLLDLAIMVIQGQLRFEWSYSKNLHQQATIERLAEQCLDELRKMIRQPDQPDSTSGLIHREQSQSRRRLDRSVLVPIQPHGSLQPFFCAHPGDGKALCYDDLIRHLSPDQPFYAFQDIAVDGRTPYYRFEEMAAHYIDAMRAVQPQGPYLLGGLSFGGFVAYEMAQQLVRQGQGVGILALLDTWSLVFEGKPAFDIDPAAGSAETLLENAQEKVRMYSGAFKRPRFWRRNAAKSALRAQALDGLPPEELLDAALDALAQTTTLPPRKIMDQIRRALLVNLGHFHCLVSYQPEVYPGRITLFRACGTAGNIHLESHTAREDPTRGWSELSPQEIEIQEVSGDHQQMMFEPHVRVMAQKLQTCLNQRSSDSLTST